jgi:hypothetical protein
VFPNLLNRIFGMKFKVVTGYEGVAMATLAMERGEVQSAARPWALTKRVHPEWIKDKTINTIVQYVTTKHPDIPDVPAVVDLAENDLQRQTLSLYASGRDIGRSIVGPPGLSHAQTEAFRAAFDATMTDAAFLTEVRSSQLETDPLPGSQLQEVVAKIINVPPEVVAAARAVAPHSK